MDKSDVESVVEEKPGITFTMLREELDAANGQLQYHIQNADVELKGRGYVKKGECADCELAQYCRGECMRRFLLQDKKRDIIKQLDDNVQKTEIAEKLAISPSTLSYHINELRENNVLLGDEVNPVIREML